MAKTFSIALLSDLHIDMKLDPESWGLAQRAFDVAQETEADHIVVAGDLFDNSTAMMRDRDKVHSYLKRERLWTPDRLSIVPGNHDIFHTPHRASTWGEIKEFGRSITRDAGDSYAEFNWWISDLIYDEDCLALGDKGEVLPFQKTFGHVCLWGADTTSYDTARSFSGYWREDTNDHLAEVAGDAKGRRVLVIHHPPIKERERTPADYAKQDWPFGLVDSEYTRLARFLKAAKVEAVLCGHLHDNGGYPQQWKIKNTRATAYLNGRTGGLHDQQPVVVVLEIPARGNIRTWEEEV